MTVSHTSVFTPMAAVLPPSVDESTLTTLDADLSKHHVAVVEGIETDELDTYDLAGIAADAREHGIPLSVVVVPGNPFPESSLRDLATRLGATHHGTVVVLSDDWAGTYSDTLSRDRLERAEDAAKNRHAGHSVEAAQAFVDSLQKPDPISWTTATCLILVALVAAIGGLYWVKARRRRQESAN
ncbi:hypothetical protein D5S18_33070 [Nocardia panacis]|uniref:TPM domain-containing protein n=1 Tax=Nocardia panacis TaxID=2340916 RepID=A0A3A4K5R5_9NOCA|nr:DUF6676 family protein [Nocardia panacis]RJO68260.1 hypothetical protein D5S18_33070 [Nocardia panacis]